MNGENSWTWVQQRDFQIPKHIIQVKTELLFFRGFQTQIHQLTVSESIRNQCFVLYLPPVEFCGNSSFKIVFRIEDFFHLERESCSWQSPTSTYNFIPQFCHCSNHLCFKWGFLTNLWIKQFWCPACCIKAKYTPTQLLLCDQISHENHNSVLCKWIHSTLSSAPFQAN